MAMIKIINVIVFVVIFSISSYTQNNGFLPDNELIRVDTIPTYILLVDSTINVDKIIQGVHGFSVFEVYCCEEQCGSSGNGGEVYAVVSYGPYKKFKSYLYENKIEIPKSLLILKTW